MLSVRTSANGHGRGERSGPGRGTHSRSELTTPHLSHLAQALNVQQLLKKKNLAFFGRFWQISARTDRLDGPEAAPDVRGVVGGAQRVHGPLIAQ